MKVPDYTLWSKQDIVVVRSYLAGVKRHLLKAGYIGGTSNGTPRVRCGQCAMPVPQGHILLMSVTTDNYGKKHSDRWCFECIEGTFLSVEARAACPAVLHDYRQTGLEG